MGFSDMLCQKINFVDTLYTHMTDFSELKTHIQETTDWLIKELATVRTSRSTPALLDGVRVDAYGVMTPLSQVASVGIEDARTLAVTPWDKGQLKHIERAITEADLGVSVSAGDTTVRVTFPELTAERRELLKKVVGEKLEHAKKAMRNRRNEAIDVLEGQKKSGALGEDDFFRGKDEVQKLVDEAQEHFESLAEKKRVEIQA